jgi:alkane 1-monooxygenase
MGKIVEFASYFVSLLLTPAIVLACLLLQPHWSVQIAVWAGWLALAVLLDAVTPRVTAVRAENRVGDAAATFLLLWLPLPVVIAVLGFALWDIGTRPFEAGQFILTAFGLGLMTSTVAGGAAHELVHARGRIGRGIGQALTCLYGYPHYPIVHLQVHHPYTAAPFDPGTSLLNEPMVAYAMRALRLTWRGGWWAERRRLTHRKLPWWSWRSRMVRCLAFELAVIVLAAVAFGQLGMALFLAQIPFALFMIFGVDYTQHYGVIRREVRPGRLERITGVHAWTSDQAFNRSVFNLGLHADHHLRPQAGFPERGAPQASPKAPMGYPGLFLMALVPPLWFKVMNPRIAAAQAASPPIG